MDQRGAEDLSCDCSLVLKPQLLTFMAHTHTRMNERQLLTRRARAAHLTHAATGVDTIASTQGQAGEGVRRALLLLWDRSGRGRGRGRGRGVVCEGKGGKGGETLTREVVPKHKASPSGLTTASAMSCCRRGGGGGWGWRGVGGRADVRTQQKGKLHIRLNPNPSTTSTTCNNFLPAAPPLENPNPQSD